jgi:uroporphyrinogen-III synthase
VNQALHGAQVVVTRPAHQAENLCRLIEQHGGCAVRFPTLKIVGIDGLPTTATNALIDLSKYQYLIFTSANAVNFAMATNGGKIAQLKSAAFVAIGHATATALQNFGLTVAIAPESGYDSEALLAVPQLQEVDKRNILVVRGQGGREEIAKVLADRGAQVDCWEGYRRVRPQVDCSALIGLLARGKVDVVTVTSAESLQNLLAMLGENDNKALTAIPLVVISNRIKRFAAELGFSQIQVSEGPSDEAILDAVIALLNEEKSG